MDEILEEGVPGGVAVLHLHARDKKTDRPVQGVRLFERLLTAACAVNGRDPAIDYGRWSQYAISERAVDVPAFRSEMVASNAGGITFGLYPVTRRGALPASGGIGRR